MLVKLDHFPGENKNIWNHHLVFHWRYIDSFMVDNFHELSIVMLVFRGVFLPYKLYSDGHSKTRTQPSRISVLQFAFNFDSNHGHLENPWFWSSTPHLDGEWLVTPVYKPWVTAIWKRSHNPRSWRLNYSPRLWTLTGMILQVGPSIKLTNCRLENHHGFS